MIVLNLLPPETRLASQRNAVLAALIVSLWVLGAATVLATAAVVGTRLFLASQLTYALNRQVSGRVTAASDVEALEFKSLATAFQRIEDERTAWSPMIKAVLATAKTDITLDQLVLDGTGRSLSLTGKADTRQALLDFESALRGAIPGAATQLPPGSLVEPTNITFTLTVKLPSGESEAKL